MSRPLAALVAKAVALASVVRSRGSAVPDVEIAPGVRMPMVAFGTAKESLQGCAVTDAVAQWLRLGGRHIDTAYDYNTQPDVGAGIRAAGVPREEVFLTTKIPGPIGKQAVMDLIMNVSLPQLGLDYVDLVLIHFPCGNTSQFPDKCGPEEWRAERLATWEGLTELRKAGKIRAVGVSNYNVGHIQETVMLGGGVPAVNQVEWHLGYHNETLLSAMRQLKVTLEAWGSLTGPTASNPGISLSDPRLQEIAKRYNASTAQVALRWSAQKGVVPVTATCTADHAQSDLDAFRFELSEDDIRALDALTPAVQLVV